MCFYPDNNGWYCTFNLVDLSVEEHSCEGQRIWSRAVQHAAEEDAASALQHIVNVDLNQVLDVTAEIREQAADSLRRPGPGRLKVLPRESECAILTEEESEPREKGGQLGR